VSTIPSGPPPIQQVVPAHASIGKPAVGLESVADKDRVLPPVEDATDIERLHHRDVIVKLSGDAEREPSQREGEQQENPQSKNQQPDTLQSDASTEQSVVTTGIPVAANPYQALHLAEFEAHTLPPGSLLDQKI
jgi:hypothetical protein